MKTRLNLEVCLSAVVSLGQVPHCRDLVAADVRRVLTVGSQAAKNDWELVGVRWTIWLAVANRLNHNARMNKNCQALFGTLVGS